MLRSSGVIVMFIGGAGLRRILVPLAAATVWSVSSWAAAQTLQPKAAQPSQAPQQQSPAPQAQPPAVPARPQWEVGCTNTQAGLECRAGQTLNFQQGTNRIQVSAILQIAPDTGQ